MSWPSGLEHDGNTCRVRAYGAGSNALLRLLVAIVARVALLFDYS